MLETAKRLCSGGIIVAWVCGTKYDVWATAGSLRQQSQNKLTPTFPPIFVSACACPRVHKIILNDNMLAVAGLLIYATHINWWLWQKSRWNIRHQSGGLHDSTGWCVWSLSFTYIIGSTLRRAPYTKQQSHAHSTDATWCRSEPDDESVFVVAMVISYPFTACSVKMSNKLPCRPQISTICCCWYWYWLLATMACGAARKRIQSKFVCVVLLWQE